jgi:hypothetical protein
VPPKRELEQGAVVRGEPGQGAIDVFRSSG